MNRDCLVWFYSSCPSSQLIEVVRSSWAHLWLSDRYGMPQNNYPALCLPGGIKQAARTNSATTVGVTGGRCNRGSGQVESTCSGTAGVHEQSPEASIIDGESSHSSQVTLPSVLACPPCSVEEIVNQPRHQSFAVVVPPPPQKWQRIARTIARTGPLQVRDGLGAGRVVVVPTILQKRALLTWLRGVMRNSNV
jgi:hypothetical protein